MNYYVRFNITIQKLTTVKEQKIRISIFTGAFSVLTNIMLSVLPFK